ncbi:CBS domain-containing protein [Tenacibaculum tangerinum]|uniref:CBS domain-containing protein n=1 Tax=Tenacibaculum tangerinum TaxID=3038772 RepID=A0ABY8L4W4_9FLAO|nr:CBS domain-containing protein [Tenacibaculum tangerinum]WGH76464.1 CBS domain-containing protein [Tenacibaculum tangerinum]
MGSQSVKAITTQKERKKFVYHLLKDVDAFERMIRDDLFEKGIQRVGAEQELCLVDQYFRPSLNALKILENVNDPHITTELALFNLEINLDPFELKEDCFVKLEKQLEELLNKVNKEANNIEQNQVILTGILPTLKRKDLVFKNMTPFRRYKTLNKVIKDLRKDDFKLHIQGVEDLILKHNSILFEACNTSFQVHLQIDVDNAIDMYNWSQAIAGPMLSVMCNSPLLLGRELWKETRIALFQQSVDLRNPSYLLREQKPRVSFGNKWVKHSVLELFTDDISRHAPLVTSDFEEDSLALLEKGIMPKLQALNLHNGTLYKWNRLCYGVHNNVAHLRIENRYIPSGPSIKDEIANAVFWVGVMQGMPKEYKKIWKKMAFEDARSNFMNAAKTGIDTYFNWCGKGIPAKKLIKKFFLPIARKGLEKSKIATNDIDYFLGIIEERIDKNTTGASWLIKNKRLLNRKLPKFDTKIVLTETICKNQQQNIPVAQWEDVDLSKSRISTQKNKLYKAMSTELFVANEHDLVELVLRVMKWNKVSHIPVVNNLNKIVGVISKKQLSNFDFSKPINKQKTAKRMMDTGFISLTPETSIDTAKKLMNRGEKTCVLIIEADELVGIFTQNDLSSIQS